MAKTKTGRPRMSADARKRARSINLTPHVDDAVVARCSPNWGPTQACSAMIARYIESVERHTEVAHLPLVGELERVLAGRYVEATDIAVLPAIAGAFGEPALQKNLSKLNYCQLLAVVDAVERRRAAK